MTVTLDLEPEIDTHLRALAEAEGMTVEQYVARLIRDAIDTSSGEAALALLESWLAEDVTGDPDELERRRRDWQTFREAMNRSHSSDRILFP